MPAPKTKTRARRRKKHQQKPAVWGLRRYVVDQTPKSIRAFGNPKAPRGEHLKGRYQIELIDLLMHPQLARGDQIAAIPTLVRKLPPPIRKFVGDLSHTEEVLVGQDLRQLELPSSGKPA